MKISEFDGIVVSDCQHEMIAKSQGMSLPVPINSKTIQETFGFELIVENSIEILDFKETYDASGDNFEREKNTCRRKDL